MKCDIHTLLLPIYLNPPYLVTYSYRSEAVVILIIVKRGKFRA